MDDNVVDITVKPSPDDAPPPKEFFLEIGGRRRRGVMDFNALAEIEAITNKAVLVSFSSLTNVSPFEIRAIVYAALKAGNPRDKEVTIENVGTWMDLGNFGEYINVVAEAIGAGYKSKDPRMLAPYVPTPTDIITQAFELAEMKPGYSFADLGCGTGETMLIAAEKFDAGKVIGFELDEGRFNEAESKLSKANRIASWTYDLRKEDIRDSGPLLVDVDVVFVYLLITANEEIRQMLESNLKAGARIVSHDFTFNWPESWLVTSKTVSGPDKMHAIFVYEVPRFEGLVN